MHKETKNSKIAGVNLAFFYLSLHNMSDIWHNKITRCLSLEEREVAMFGRKKKANTSAKESNAEASRESTSSKKSSGSSCKKSSSAKACK